MKKLLGLMILCIPLYAWGSESFSVNLSLYETPRYAMSTSYDDHRYSPIHIHKSPSVVEYLLEGLSGVVGGVVGLVVAYPLLYAAMGDEIATSTGTYLGFLFGMSGGVTFAAKRMGYEGSYWMSCLGTVVGTVAGIGGILVSFAGCDFCTGEGCNNPFILPMIVVSINLPIVGAVWGYHLGGASTR